MKGTTLTDREISNLCSKFDIEVREEASYILWYIWREIRAGYANLQACIGALVEDEVLYRALKKAHERGEYERIRKWKIGILQNASASKLLGFS